MPPIFGHVGSGQHADGGADHGSKEGHDQAANDGILQAAAVRSGRRYVVGEDMQG